MSAPTTAPVSFGISRRIRSSIFSSSARIEAASFAVRSSPTERASRSIDGVGRDLQRLGGAGVLGVLEHLLLAAGPADEIERRLGQRQRLPGDALGDAAQELQRVAALAQLAQPRLHALGVVARLTQVRLQPAAIRAAGRHRDLRLQHAHERHLAGVRFIEVLHDLLLGSTHVVGLRQVGVFEVRNCGAAGPIRAGGAGTAGLGAVLVVRLRAAGLGEAAADHVADGQDRHVQPRLLGAQATGVGLVDHGSGDQDADEHDDERDELGRLERRLRLGGETAHGVVLGLAVALRALFAGRGAN